MVVRMERAVRVAGLLGSIGAVIWIANLLFEYAHVPNLDPANPSHATGGAFLANQLGFLVAMTGIVAMAAGFVRSRLAGRGVFAGISAGLFFGGWALLWVSAIVSLAILAAGGTVPDALGVPQAIGGIASTIGAWLIPVAVLRAKAWRGWQRFAPLALAVYQIPFFVLTASNNGNPPEWAEATWQVFLGILGFAMFSTRAAAEAPPLVEAEVPSA
jgi:hypothetical protein